MSIRLILLLTIDEGLYLNEGNRDSYKEWWQSLSRAALIKGPKGQWHVHGKRGHGQERKLLTQINF